MFKGSVQRACWVIACLLLLASTAKAQLSFGEFTNKASGTVAAGYTADFGNLTASDHGWTVGGVANITGDFYNPRFINYNISPYANQSRANSDFQSISNTSGVSMSANLFAGTRFPGTFSYSKAYNSNGSYNIPGLSNYVTHGNNDDMAIGWSGEFGNFPTLSTEFQHGNSSYSVYGTNLEGADHFNTFSAHSTYHIDGLNASAFYNLGTSRASIPELLSTATVAATHTTNDAYGIALSHQIPFRGSFSSAATRSSWNSSYAGENTSGSLDLISASVAFQPFPRFSTSAHLNFSDNLSGQLIQQILSAGGTVTTSSYNQSSNSLEVATSASYALFPGVSLAGFFEHRGQYFMGRSYGVKSFGVNTAVVRRLRNGRLNASLVVAGNSPDNTNENSISFSNDDSYSTNIKGWDVSATFGYGQNVQTLLVTYMNSTYHFGGNIARRFGTLSVAAGASGARTGLTDQRGDDNTSQNYFASLNYSPWFTVTGSYAKSSGQAITTGAGLVPVPVPTPILPGQISLFGGDSYAFGFGSSPIKRLTLSGSFSRSHSNVVTDSVTSANNTEEANFVSQYHFRKMNVNCGFSRLQQGFSGSGSVPQTISSFYIGVSRWFNFF